MGFSKQEKFLVFGLFGRLDFGAFAESASQPGILTTMRPNLIPFQF